MSQILEPLREIIDLPVELFTVILVIYYSSSGPIKRPSQVLDQRLLGSKSPRDGPELTQLCVVRATDQ